MKLLKLFSFLLTMNLVAAKFPISLSFFSQTGNESNVANVSNEIDLSAELLRDQSEEITEALDQVALSWMQSGNFSLTDDSNSTNSHWELIGGATAALDNEDSRPNGGTHLSQQFPLEESASELQPKSVKVWKKMKKNKKRKTSQARRRKKGRGKKGRKGKGKKKHHRRMGQYCVRHGYRHHLCNKHCTYRPRTTCVTITTTSTTTSTTNTPSTSTPSTTASSTPSSTITSTSSTTPSSTITSTTVSSTPPTSSTTVPPVQITVTQNILVYDSICSWKRHLMAKLQQLFYYIEANRPIDYAYYGNVLQKVLKSMACICRCKEVPLPQQMRLLFNSQHIYNKIAAKFPSHYVANKCRLRSVLFPCASFKVKV